MTFLSGTAQKRNTKEEDMQVKRRLGKPICLFLCILMIAVGGGWSLTSRAAETGYKNGPDIYGDAYCVMDGDTGDIICGKNAMGCYHPASITKVLTALVTLEQVEDLDATLTFSESAVNVAANSSTLPPKAMAGEQMSVWDCLNGMMLASGNECAAELAEYVAGSQEAFADMMNEKAAQIGATNTHFVNAHGLDHYEHYTNPYDMALIFRAALENETFAKLDSTVTYTIPATNLYGSPRVLTMGHQMVAGNISYDGVYAGKTGRTALAGRTLLTAAQHNGHHIIVVVMHCGEDYVYKDTQILLDYAYALIDGQEPWEWVDCQEEMVAVANVNLREKASEHATVRGSVLTGQKVMCTGRYADWSRVVIDNVTYYVKSEWLQYQDGTPSPVTTSTTEAETEMSAGESAFLQEEEKQVENQTMGETELSLQRDQAGVPNGNVDSRSGNMAGRRGGWRDIILIVICANTLVMAGVISWWIWRSRKQRKRQIWGKKNEMGKHGGLK